MTSPESHTDKADEKLSPELEAVIGRARRSFGFSMGILLLGFIAIGGALVYRASREEASGPSDIYPLAAISVPQGANVVSIVPGDGMLAVTYERDGATNLRLIDGTSGEIIREIAVISE